ncbi:MAG: tyrosine-type recombinase/integrase, partial [Myxococcota bacterium]
AGPPSHLVFPRRSIKGGQFDPEHDQIIQPRKALARALAGAGIDKHIRFHDLRHTYGTLLVQAGVDVRTVQELLGHSTMRMTQRYVHLAAEPGEAVKGFTLGGKTKKPTGED